MAEASEEEEEDEEDDQPGAAEAAVELGASGLPLLIVQLEVRTFRKLLMQFSDVKPIAMLPLQPSRHAM